MLRDHNLRKKFLRGELRNYKSIRIICDKPFALHPCEGIDF